jgi:hypothetical protein
MTTYTCINTGPFNPAARGLVHAWLLADMRVS